MEKVLLIGIDGADYNILKELLDNNELKNLANISEHGQFSRLMSTIPPLSPAAWTSVFTGAPPYKHGIWGFLKQKEGEYFYKPVTSRDRKVKAVWNLLTEKNKKSIIVNVPFSYPPEKINGVMITGLGSPGKDSNFVYPPSLKKFILENFPNFDVDFNEGKLERSSADIYELEKNIIKTERDIVNCSIYLLNENRWDFGVIVLRSLDTIQHFAFDDSRFIRQHYKRVDKLVGKILDEVDNRSKETKVIICSDHGFRRVFKRFYVNTWLEREGYLRLKSNSSNLLLKIGIDAEKFRSFMWRVGLKNLLVKVEHSNIAKYLLKIIPSSSHQYLFNTDWNQTKAFFYRASNGLIKINIQGREPQGCIDANNALKLGKELKLKLEKIIDPTTGAKVFRNVFLKEELGIDAYDFPEIILLPNEGYEIMDYNINGSLFEDIHNRPGDHDLYGIFISNFEPLMKVECAWDVGKLVKKVFRL